MKKTFYIVSILILFARISDSQGAIFKIWNTTNSTIPTNSLWSLFIDNDGIVWVGSSNIGLIKFDGNNFTNYNTTNSPVKANWVTSIASDKFHNLWISTIKSGGGQGALMKFDRFSNWSFFDTSNSGISNGNQWCVAVDTNNIIWCSLNNVSKFNGTSWIVYDSTNSPIKFSGGREIFVDSHNNKWFGKDRYGLYKLANDSQWTFYNRLNSGLGGSEVNKIREDNFGNLWITMSYYGITKFDPSNNLWQNWTPQNSGLNYAFPWGIWIDRNVKWIGFNGGDTLCSFNDTSFVYHNPFGSIYDIKEDVLGNLWLATTEGLVEFNKNGIVASINDQSGLIKDFELFQNYPNPFNPTTKIKYELANSSNVSLIIFDLQGKEIETLLNKRENAGSHSVEFNALNLPSGIYFYTLKTEKFSETKKMILLK